MTRSTPEGARDYLVPSRVQPGTFYALPQSPQIFKQLLMVGGYEKYFQIVRCFRDEDLRADRQPEFTQIDLEMSFPQQERIFEVIEPLIERVCEVAGFDVQAPFPRLTYAEAMRSYGSDKPDCASRPCIRWRTCCRIWPPTACRWWPSTFPQTGRAQPQGARRVEGLRQERGLRVYDDAKRLERDYPGAHGASARTLRRQRERSADAGHLGRRAQGPSPRRDRLPGLRPIAPVRRAEIQRPPQAARPARRFEFLWVLDFPMFEWDEEENRWNAAHHPFTSVHDEDLEKLTTDPARCRAKSYDLVLNGMELGSGSIRIHRRDVQTKVFAALGFSEEEARRRFGFLLDALEYGAPPHGGIALGLDRLVMILAGETSHPRRHPVPQNRARHGPDVRRSGRGARQGSEGPGHRHPALIVDKLIAIG